jgi:hypothetical protein
MSNEPQSLPSLRLKPRLSSGQAVTASEAPAETPAAPAVPTGGQTPAAAPLPAQTAPAPLPNLIPAPLPPEPVPAPVSTSPAPAPAAEDPGKFKLKPRINQPAAITPVTPAPPSVMATAVVVPPKSEPPPIADMPAVAKPTLPAAALASPAFEKPAVPNNGRPNMPIAPLPSGAPKLGPITPRPPEGSSSQKNEDSRAGKNGLKLILALLFVALGLFGVFAYNLWFSEPAAPVAAAEPAQPPSSPAPVAPTQAAAPNPASSSAPAAESQKPAPAASAPVVVSDPQSLPGKLVAQARDTAAAHDTAMTAPVNEIIAATASASAAAPAAAAPPVAETPPAPAPAPEPVVVPRPEPSANFRAYVVNLKINGVFQGENARAMLNGKMYRLGETVDSSLGIVFLRLEPEEKRIVFEDAKGALMTRRY